MIMLELALWPSIPTTYSIKKKKKKHALMERLGQIKQANIRKINYEIMKL